MRAGRGQNLTVEPTGDRKGAQPREWVVAAILYGLMLVEGLRQGGFWRAGRFRCRRGGCRAPPCLHLCCTARPS